jgi:uncharacterized protein
MYFMIAPLGSASASPVTSKRPPLPGHPSRDYTLDLRDELAGKGHAMEIMTGSGVARAELDPQELTRAEPGPDGRAGFAAVRFLLVLTHGAGGSADSPDLLAARDAALGLGGLVARVTQPYRVKGARAPGPAERQDAAWVEIVAALTGLVPGVPLVQGGRSNGARVACRTAAAVGARAVIALAFPLKPPGPKGQSRLAELRAATAGGAAVLVVNGERDPFGIPGPRQANRVIVVPGETHALRGHRAVIAGAVADWLPGVLGSIKGGTVLGAPAGG